MGFSQTNLKYDPYRIFRGSTSPSGLYARQKWLGEAGEAAWQSDYEEQTDKLLEGQGQDGSWDGSLIETVRRLFGLHLTVRQPNQEIDKALEWLINRSSETLRQPHQKGEGPLKGRDLVGLPFTTGSRESFQYGATLFIASIFGKENDPRIMKCYGLLSKEIATKGIRFCGWASFSNYIRALVVHSKYSRSSITEQAVNELAGVQKPNGQWPSRLPFYQNINALAHLDFEIAEEQLGPAFDRLFKTQNKDGSWGRSQREWNTFLVVHALRNKGHA